MLNLFQGQQLHHGVIKTFKQYKKLNLYGARVKKPHLLIKKQRLTFFKTKQTQTKTNKVVCLTFS